MLWPASPPQSGRERSIREGKPAAGCSETSGSGTWARSTDTASTPRDVVGIPVRAGRTMQAILQQLGDAVARGRRGLDRHRVAVGDDVGDADRDDAQRQPDLQGGV